MNVRAWVRVLVADDQALFRSGLARLLELDKRVHVVAEAADGVEAVSLCAELNPDVVLMDLRMPNLDGIRATDLIVSANPEIQVLILTSFEDDCHVVDALRAGAAGYVLKDARPESIVNSILAVHSGERVMAAAVVDRVIGMLDGDRSARDAHAGLTPRELEVLKLIASGGANKQIAFRLRISERTVRNHVSKVYEKLKIYDRCQVVLYAVTKGLVEV